MNTGFVETAVFRTNSFGSPESSFEYRNDLPPRANKFVLDLGHYRTPVAAKACSASQAILLVEDNDDLRTVLETYLAMMGYDVVPCCDGQFASAAFHSGTPIDALISDLDMPGKSGLELARELTEIRPSLPVLIVSGALISSDMAFEMRERDWKFIAKPCRLPVILSTLQLVLAPNAGQAA